MSPQRLAASRRVLAKERAALPLFAEHVAAAQETPEARIARIDAEHVEHLRARRKRQADLWRRCRRAVRALSPELAREIVAEWRAERWLPKTAHYFADWLRCKKGISCEAAS